MRNSYTSVLGHQKKDNLPESEYTYNTALQHWRELAGLCEADLAGGDPYESTFLPWLREVSFIDRETQNTTEEVLRCLELCVERGVGELTLVSAPFHIPRCIQQAQIVLEGLRDDPRYLKLARNLSAVSSDINPTGMQTSDVVIVEPMHRGDNPKVPFYKQVRRIFQFLRKPDLAFEFCSELEALTDRFEQRLKSE